MIDLANTILKTIYGREITAADCANEDFKAGFAAGITDVDSFLAIDAEYERRGLSDLTPEFKTWKRGFWAGRFYRQQTKMWPESVQ